MSVTVATSVRCLQEGTGGGTDGGTDGGTKYDNDFSTSGARNLSDEGTANSYIVSSAGTYSISPVKGNSSEPVGSVASAEVLWETFGTDENIIKGNLISGARYENGRIYFKTADAYREGNAVIAAKDANGTILWSWHIWLTDQPEGHVYNNNAGTMMDRNLGATSATAGDVGALGLLYQWGRKEPFPRPKDYKFSNNQDEKVVSSSGSTKIFRYVTAEMVEDQVSAFEFGSKAYAVAYPFTYILGTESNDFDWLHGEHDATLWTESDKGKSVNDPCPYGWRVPDGDAFVAFDIDEVEDAAAVVDVKGMYGWHLVDKSTGIKMFMPGAGRRSYENGVLTNMNNYGFEHNPMPWIGYYWTAGTANGNQSKSMFFDLNTTRAVNNRYQAQKTMYRGNGMQVRCVRDDK